MVKALVQERVDTIKRRLLPPHNGTGVGPHDEELGGIGGAGFPEALIGFLDLCELHKSLNRKVAFSYWICRLTAELLESGTLKAVDLSAAQSALVAECLSAEFQPTQEYLWPSWLETVAAIERHGLRVSGALQSPIATIRSKDRSSRTLEALRQLR